LNGDIQEQLTNLKSPFQKTCSPLGSGDPSSGASWDKWQHKVADLQPAWVRSGETLLTNYYLYTCISLKYGKN